MLGARVGRYRRGPCSIARDTGVSSNHPAIHRIWPGWTTSTNWSAVAHEFSIDLANAAALREDSDEVLDEDIPDTGALASFLAGVAGRRWADELPEHGAGGRDDDDAAHREGAGVSRAS